MKNEFCSRTRLVGRSIAPAVPVVVLVSLVALMGACQDGPTEPAAVVGASTVSLAKGGPGGGGKPPTRIVFSSQRDQPGNMDVYSSNADGTNVIRLTFNAALDHHPALSHDGTRIAFVSTRFGGQSVLVMNADGSGVQQLTAVATCSSPAWSTDDTRLAFSCYNGVDDDSEIYTMSASGGVITQLTYNTATDVQPTWSSRTPEIAFASTRHGNWEIYKMTDGGTAVTRLTNGTGSDSDPKWSPDGRRIAFVSTRTANVEIHVMNADGTQVVNITNNTATDEEPGWSPDSKKIVFQSYRSGTLALYTMNADGTLPVLITEFVASQPAWGN